MTDRRRTHLGLTTSVGHTLRRGAEASLVSSFLEVLSGPGYPLRSKTLGPTGTKYFKPYMVKGSSVCNRQNVNKLCSQIRRFDYRPGNGCSNYMLTRRKYYGKEWRAREDSNL